MRVAIHLRPAATSRKAGPTGASPLSRTERSTAIVMSSTATCRSSSVTWQTARSASIASSPRSPLPVPGRLMLTLEPPISRIAVMPVGDHCVPVDQVLADGSEQSLVGDLPDSMADPVRRPGGQYCRILAGLLHDVRRRTAALVHQQDRVEIGLCGPHELQPVGHRSWHDILVR